MVELFASIISVRVDGNHAPAVSDLAVALRTATKVLKSSPEICTDIVIRRYLKRDRIKTDIRSAAVGGARTSMTLNAVRYWTGSGTATVSELGSFGVLQGQSQLERIGEAD